MRQGKVNENNRLPTPNVQIPTKFSFSMQCQTKFVQKPTFPFGLIKTEATMKQNKRTCFFKFQTLPIKRKKQNQKRQNPKRKKIPS